MRNHSYENEFHLHDHFHANQSHFHFNGFARRLVLKLRQRATRKWPITGKVDSLYARFNIMQLLLAQIVVPSGKCKTWQDITMLIIILL